MMFRVSSSTVVETTALLFLYVIEFERWTSVHVTRKYVMYCLVRESMSLSINEVIYYIKVSQHSCTIAE